MPADDRRRLDYRYHIGHGEQPGEQWFVERVGHRGMHCTGIGFETADHLFDVERYAAASRAHCRALFRCDPRIQCQHQLVGLLVGQR